MLDEKSWSSLILHDWERIPHGINSDIDYVIRGPKPKELIHALIDYCEENGWSLVQILEHEVDAHYCVCVKNSAPFESVLLDVCWDYRRKGIDLIENDTLFEGAWQPEGRTFKVPAPHLEFLYRLVKAAAKAKDLGELSELEAKMRAFFEDHSEECLKVLRDVTDYKGGPDWDELRLFFDDSPYFNQIRKGRKIGMREVKLYAKRIAKPTGLLVGFPEGGKATSAIIETVTCAFRKVEHQEGKIPWWQIKSHLIKSTLVAQRADLCGGGLILSQDEGDCVEAGARKIFDFLSSRIKTEWDYLA